VARYELWGLVVSHNNIESFADLVHDSTSVDTKVLCVIWGPNLADNDFHRVRYTSGQFTCYFKYPHGVVFDRKALGNNHLITDDDGVRERIGEVRVGDQIRLSGLLVNYRMDDWDSFWRRTSVSRKDAGCEVVFVETLEILRRGAPLWYAMYAWSWRVLIAVPVLFFVFAWIESRDPSTSRLGEL